MSKATLPPGCAEDAARLSEIITTLAEREGVHVNTYCMRHLKDANFMSRLEAGRVAPRTMASAENLLAPRL